MLKTFFYILLFLYASSAISQTDIWKPDVPILDSVSVDYTNLNGDVFIGWEPSDSLDVMGYYIYKNTSLTAQHIWTVIDSVFGRLNTSYIDYTADAEYKSEQYVIAAFDSSHNLSPLTDEHHTIYIFPYQEVDNCQYHIRIKWNSYYGWPSGVDHYDIFRDNNYSGTTSYVGTVNGTVTEYVDTNVTDTSSYCYFVRAEGFNGFSSSSNLTCIVIDIPNDPKFIAGLNASVETKNNVSLKFLSDTSAENITEYRILRSDSLYGTYSVVKSIPFSNNPLITYTDKVPSDSIKYFYKIGAYNSCSREILESGVVSNIVITAQNNGDLVHNLFWEDFYQWPGSINNFVLHRIDDETDDVIVNSTYSMNNYNDDISDLPFRDKFYSGRFCYYVQYFEANNSPYNYRDSSKSNIVCTEEFSRVFMPNAFSPLVLNASVNSIFKPSLLFIKKEGYYFGIFNRWGENIFETTDPEKGWNGKGKCDKISPFGTYVYVLIYQDNTGESHKKTGTFISVQ